MKNGRMIIVILKNIKDYTKNVKKHLSAQIKAFTTPPSLAIVQVGNNEASNRYVRNKIKDCEEIGITAHRYWFPEEISEEGLIAEVQEISNNYDGVIVQLPLPPHLRKDVIVAAVPKEKDVDGFRVDSEFKPATPLGIMKYLEYCDFDLCGKDVLIIGRSDIVGKPLARMMTDADATVTLAHSKSKKLYEKHICNSDLIVCAVGKPKFLNCFPIYVPVIDVGINFNENGKMCGDCFNTENRDVTPVPGGVGLLTRCALLENVVKAKLLNERW